MRYDIEDFGDHISYGYYTKDSKYKQLVDKYKYLTLKDLISKVKIIFQI